LFVTGGTSPFTYIWSNTATTSAINNLAAGTYSVTITDALGCEGVDTFVINNSDALFINANYVNASCNGFDNGSITVIASGGSGNYSFAWSPNGQTTQNLSGLEAGTYTVTATDANGCSATTTVIIT